jgi:hypothetical protein
MGAQDIVDEAVGVNRGRVVVSHFEGDGSRTLASRHPWSGPFTTSVPCQGMPRWAWSGLSSFPKPDSTGHHCLLSTTCPQEGRFLDNSSRPSLPIHRHAS